jgi:hypothetical protein
MKQNETEEVVEDPKENILSESDLGSELDDELFNIADIRKYKLKLGITGRNTIDDCRQ